MASRYDNLTRAMNNSTSDKPIRGRELEMSKTDSGHCAFKVSDKNYFARFLMIGAANGTYHCGAAKTFEDAYTLLIRVAASSNGVRAVQLLTQISIEGRAVSNDHALFALAVFATSPIDEVRVAALEAVIYVARTSTHLFTFLNYSKELGLTPSRRFRRLVQRWYAEKSVDSLAYQVVKYRQREGWTHLDAIRWLHPKPPTEAHSTLYRYIAKPTEESVTRASVVLPLVSAYEESKLLPNSPAGVSRAIQLVQTHRLPWETLPTAFLGYRSVWQALIPSLNLMAMIRNLGRMSGLGVFDGSSELTDLVISRLKDERLIQRSRVHPMAILLASSVYSQGHGFRGELTWMVDQRISNALNDAFYLAFKNVVPTGKKFYLAIDISASMTRENVPGSFINNMQAATAMALVTMESEQDCIVKGFANKACSESKRSYSRVSGMQELPVTPGRRLDDNVRSLLGIDMGATDLSLPIKDMIDNNLEVDTLVVYTDNETTVRGVHPSVLLNQYRQKTGKEVKMIVVGMEGRPFTIADPKDPNSLDIAGFDSSVPSVISEFSK